VSSTSSLTFTGSRNLIPQQTDAPDFPTAPLRSFLHRLISHLRSMAPTPITTSIDSSNSTASGDNGGNSNFSNDANLVALIIAIAAFIISFVQTFLQFLTSSSVREKTSRGALGGWHVYSNTSWDFSTFRLRVTYPVVELDCFKILELRQEYEAKLNKLCKDTDYQWEDYSLHKDRKVRAWHVWHGTSVLTNVKDNPVTAFALFLRPLALFEWISFLFRAGWRERVAFATGARASWANMISCLNLPARQAKKLINRHELATVIPSAIDAPWQRTSLANIALCSFVLGLSSVEIDIDKGIITARNEHASITSMEANIPGVPYLVALQGDLDSLAKNVRQASPEILRSVAYRAKGFIDFVHFYANPLFFQPMLILYGLLNGWKGENWNKYYIYRLKSQLYTKAGNLYWEAGRGEILEMSEEEDLPAMSVDGDNSVEERRMSMSDFEEDKQRAKEEEGVTFWRDLRVGGCPSLLQVLAFMPYHCTCSGFPLDSYLASFHKTVRRGAANWWNGGGKELCRVDPDLSRNIANDKVTFIDRTSSFLLTAGCTVRKSSSGSRSWIFHDSFKHFMYEGDGIGTLRWALALDGPLHVTEIIHDLLIGTSVDSLRDYLVDEIPAIIDPLHRFEKTTVEAELYFALLCVEARIAELWEKIALNGRDPEGEASEEVIGQGLACFLAFWISLCRRTTPFSSPEAFKTTADNMLQGWRGNEKPCIPQLELSIPGVPDPVSLVSRGWFHQWIEDGERKEYMRKLLTWLQLRSILVYHFLCCNEDSSKIAEAESEDIKITMA